MIDTTDYKMNPAGSELPHVLWVGRMSFTGGYGSMTRNSLRALSQAGIEYLCFDSWTGQLCGTANDEIWNVEEGSDKKLIGLHGDRKLAVIINELPTESEDIEATGNARLIAYILFETASVPFGWMRRLNQMDEVWVPTHFNLETFSDAGVPKEKLKLVPLCVDTKLFDGRCEPLAIPGRRKFVFLYVFINDNRKDIGLLLRAYFRAFKKSDDVSLVLKTIYGSDDDEIVHTIRRSVAPEYDFDDPKLPHVILIGEDLPPERMKRLYQACDVYATTERAKGWDLPAMEAMAMGKPVVSIDWSGSTEFLHENNAFLIPPEDNLIPVAPQLGTNQSMYFNQMWPDVDEDNVVAALREAYRRKDLREEYGRRGQEEVRNKYSIGVASQRIRKLLESYDDNVFGSRGNTLVALRSSKEAQRRQLIKSENEIRDEITRAFTSSYSWKIGAFIVNNARRYLGWLPFVKNRIDRLPVVTLEPKLTEEDINRIRSNETR